MLDSESSSFTPSNTGSRGQIVSFDLSDISCPLLSWSLLSWSLLEQDTTLIHREKKAHVTKLSLYVVRVQKKCAPGLPENRRRTIGSFRFLPPDQKQEGEHGQVCQSLQPQQETAIHMQVGALPSSSSSLDNVTRKLVVLGIH